jgi:phospholipase B1
MAGQARLLVARMKADPHITIAEDWKVVTIFIGANDLCDYCQNPVWHTQYSFDVFCFSFIYFYQRG